MQQVLWIYAGVMKKKSKVKSLKPGAEAQFRLGWGQIKQSASQTEIYWPNLTSRTSLNHAWSESSACPAAWSMTTKSAAPSGTRTDPASSCHSPALGSARASLTLASFRVHLPAALFHPIRKVTT